MELMEMQTNELKKAAEFGTPLYVFHEEELQACRTERVALEKSYRKQPDVFRILLAK